MADRSVLLVEEEDGIALVLERALQRSGWAVTRIVGFRKISENSIHAIAPDNTEFDVDLQPFTLAILDWKLSPLKDCPCDELATMLAALKIFCLAISTAANRQQSLRALGVLALVEKPKVYQAVTGQLTVTDYAFPLGAHPETVLKQFHDLLAPVS